jgi:hypothetical protein
MTIIFLSIIFVLLFIVGNLFRKYEQLEIQCETERQKALDIYSAVSITLHTMRTLDERRMFEQDDEVGVVFQELVDVVNNLRPFIYETLNDTPKIETE